MKLLISSNKGGPGKSTMATNLAVEYQRLGYKTLLIEIDATVTTASTWANDREEHDVPPLTVIRKGGNLSGTIEELGEAYDAVIVDAPGADTRETRTAAVAVDALLVPVRTSQADVDEALKMREMIQDAQDRNPNLKACAILTQAPTNAFAAEISETKAALEDYYDMAETVIYLRKAYQTAMSEGLGVIEGKDSKAKGEIQNLAREVEEYING